MSALGEIEDRPGAPVARFEIARRVFWTALGDACEREGVARGWADAAIATAEHDHVMLKRVRRAALPDVPLAVRGCDRVLDPPAGRTWGAVRPAGAVERSVADVVADRLLSSVGAIRARGWTSISVTARVCARCSDGLAVCGPAGRRGARRGRAGFRGGRGPRRRDGSRDRPRARAGRHGVHPRSDPRAALGSRGRRCALAIGGAVEGSGARPRLAGERRGACETPGERGTGRDRAVQPSR